MSFGVLNEQFQLTRHPPVRAITRRSLPTPAGIPKEPRCWHLERRTGLFCVLTVRVSTGTALMVQQTPTDRDTHAITAARELKEGRSAGLEPLHSGRTAPTRRSIRSTCVPLRVPVSGAGTIGLTDAERDRRIPRDCAIQPAIRGNLPLSLTGFRVVAHWGGSGVGLVGVGSGVTVRPMSPAAHFMVETASSAR
jgi:hypothetical protein